MSKRNTPEEEDVADRVEDDIYVEGRADWDSLTDNQKREVRAFYENES